jgi:hypothetical protein
VCKSFAPKGQWERATRITTVDKFLQGRRYLIALTKLSHSAHIASQEHHNLQRAVHWTEGSIVLSTAVIDHCIEYLRPSFSEGAVKVNTQITRREQRKHALSERNEISFDMMRSALNPNSSDRNNPLSSRANE